MGHHHQRLLRMDLGQSTQCRHDPAVKLAGTLTATGRKVRLKLQPLRPKLGLLGLDIGRAQSLQHTKVLLPQRRVQHHAYHRHTGVVRVDWAGGLACPRQVAAYQTIQWFICQPRAQTASLLQSHRIERHIRLTLKTQFAIPVGLAMANQD